SVSIEPLNQRGSITPSVHLPRPIDHMPRPTVYLSGLQPSAYQAMSGLQYNGQSGTLDIHCARGQAWPSACPVSRSSSRKNYGDIYSWPNVNQWNMTSSLSERGRPAWRRQSG